MAKNVSIAAIVDGVALPYFIAILIVFRFFPVPAAIFSLVVLATIKVQASRLDCGTFCMTCLVVALVVVSVLVSMLQHYNEKTEYGGECGSLITKSMSASVINVFRVWKLDNVKNEALSEICRDVAATIDVKSDDLETS